VSREYTVDFEPLGRRVRVTEGETILEAARKAGVGLNAVCGGNGTCGTCRVRVVEGEVSARVEAEEGLRATGERLACRTRVLGDVRVDVPPESISAPQRAQIEGMERPVEIDPAVQVFDITADPPAMEDLRSDEARVGDALREQHRVEVRCLDPEALKRLPKTARETGWHFRAAIKDDEVLAFLPRDASPLGLAVDIGTTKVAVYLLDLDTGETLGASGGMNPQITYGEDVIARISYAVGGDDRAASLHEGILREIGERARDLCARSGRDPSEILETVLVGNTCMHHLALGLPVAQLGMAPYVPALSSACDIKARDLGLSASAPGASVHILPNVAGFVGADHVAMILATGMHETPKVTLGLDIGTNTEISLAAEGRLWSCSCASGPAFEGAHIRDGMRAAPGAIEWVRLEREPGQARSQPMVAYQTIGDAPPAGLCGSAVLDAVAELRKQGVLAHTGSMQAGSHPRLHGEGRDASFLLVPAGERGAPRDIGITRKDVNEIQLAKAAIRAGVETLLLEAGLEADRVEQVFVVGAFGTYLDVGSALGVGMFPPLPRERFFQVGNAAGMGAKKVLLSRRSRKEAARIARSITYVELTTHPGFVKRYTDALMLP